MSQTQVFLIANDLGHEACKISDASTPTFIDLLELIGRNIELKQMIIDCFWRGFFGELKNV